MNNEMEDDFLKVQLTLTSSPICSIEIFDDRKSEVLVDDELSEGFEEVSFDICITNQDEETIKIGTLQGYILHEGLDLDTSFDVFDIIGGDVFDMYETLQGKNVVPFVVDNYIESPFFFITGIEIEENYRGKGIGTAILNHLSEIFETTKAYKEFYSLGGIMLYAQPILNEYDKAKLGYKKTDEFKNRKNKLIDFYLKNGFKKVKSKKKSDYMFKSFE